MTEIGESSAVIAEEQLQENHWVKVEYTYGNGLPVEGGRWHTFVFQNKQGG